MLSLPLKVKVNRTFRPQTFAPHKLKSRPFPRYKFHLPPEISSLSFFYLQHSKFFSIKTFFR